MQRLYLFLLCGVSSLVHSTSGGERGEDFQGGSFLELSVGPGQLTCARPFLKKKTYIPKGSNKRVVYSAQLGYLKRWDATPFFLGSKAGGAFMRSRHKKLGQRGYWNTSCLLGLGFGRLLAYGEAGYVQHFLRSKPAISAVRFGAGGSLRITKSVGFHFMWHTDHRKHLQIREYLFGIQYWFGA